MEEKIDKLFHLFSDLKNQQLFGLSIQQLIAIYSDHPACLYQILKNTNKLIYSKAVDPRLRLEHRQVSAAIIEKTYALYWYIHSLNVANESRLSCETQKIRRSPRTSSTSRLEPSNLRQWLRK
jgi:hypothetical protein